MFERNWVQICAKCGETTPHSKRLRLHVSHVVASGLFALALAASIDKASWMPLAFGTVPALLVVLMPANRHLAMRCERCRNRAVQLDRRTAWSPFDTNSTFDPF